jgi:hypothetical protein
MCVPASNKSALCLSNHQKAATIRKLAHGFALPWLQSEELHFFWLTFGVFYTVNDNLTVSDGSYSRCRGTIDGQSSITM